MEVKVLFTLSKSIHPKHGIVVIGKYQIEPLPGDSTGAGSPTFTYVLRFEDVMRDGERGSHPQEDARLFLGVFSVFMGAQVEIKSAMLNSLPVGWQTSRAIYRETDPMIEELPPLANALDRISQLDLNIARQYLRACETFRTAITLMSENQTLSYFLLTISIECLANCVIAEGGTCDRFKAFIFGHLENRAPFDMDEQLGEVLQEIYYNHRSGYTHGGKGIPEAVLLADRLGRAYVKNEIDGKEVRTPGLKWYVRVVREVLINFLIHRKELSGSPRDLIKDLSLEHGVVKLKAKRDLSAGTIIMAKDVDLD